MKKWDWADFQQVKLNVQSVGQPQNMVRCLEKKIINVSSAMSIIIQLLDGSLL